MEISEGNDIMIRKFAQVRFREKQVVEYDKNYEFICARTIWTQQQPV